MKIKTIMVPFTPQPELDATGMWHWKDCQWTNGGLGFPRSGITDHAPWRRGYVEFVSELNSSMEVVDVHVRQIKGEWCWVGAFRNPSPKNCRTVTGLIKALKRGFPATLKVYASASGADTGIWATAENAFVFNLGGGRYAYCSKKEYDVIKGSLIVLPA